MKVMRYKYAMKDEKQMKAKGEGEGEAGRGTNTHIWKIWGLLYKSCGSQTGAYFSRPREEVKVEQVARQVRGKRVQVRELGGGGS